MAYNAVCLIGNVACYAFASVSLISRKKVCPDLSAFLPVILIRRRTTHGTVNDRRDIWCSRYVRHVTTTDQFTNGTVVPFTTIGTTPSKDLQR
jgi:hypothetical protein